MKKEVKTKRITVDKLAIMMNNSFEALRKDVSGNSKVSALILKEIVAIHEDNKKFGENILSLNSDGISYNRKIENLTVRVEKLELSAR